MNLSAWTHIFYITLTLVLTLWTGNVLRTRGVIFLKELYHGKQDLAEALSSLKSVSFYLFHAGIALLLISKVDGDVTLTTAIEHVSTKIGIVVLVLAASHFLHSYLYSRNSFRTTNKPSHSHYGYSEVNRSDAPTPTNGAVS